MEAIAAVVSDRELQSGSSLHGILCAFHRPQSPFWRWRATVLLRFFCLFVWLGGCVFFPLFFFNYFLTGGETEAQKGGVICPQVVVNLETPSLSLSCSVPTWDTVEWLLAWFS